MYSARTTPMPSIQELTALFDILPVMPLPPPRKRGVQAAVKNPATSPRTDDPAAKASPAISQPAIPPSSSISSWPLSALTFLRRLFFFLPFLRPTPSTQTGKPASRPPNPFLALKTGKKTIVIAAVDSGSISFFRFGQGVFEEWPMA
jgi:tRNA-splicing endonuclease subunit Sen54